jgi:class 3 adenylate cyclase/tetratricopeptide (TPR) repeat protein
VTATRDAVQETELLKPYLPRLLIEWLRETPDASFRQVEGSLAFVDISGFTKMCERLARKGKVGAEEVTDVLDLCFTQLLGVAYEYGGGVIKWGGDAVLLLFTGLDHEARACRAAAGMRRTLRQFGRLRTSAGLVSLRMSVGINSGLFDFFVVGGSHRELLVAGPEASHTVTMESTAEGGEILISRATAAALDPAVLGPAKGEGVLLAAEPDAPVERAQPVDARGLDLAGCIPTHIRQHLLSGESDAEHRHVAVAFVQFKQTDDLLVQAGHEGAAAALDELMRTVQDVALEHGVSFHETDIDKDGGKILLVAGAPLSFGNEEDRALRALRVILETPHHIPIRIGVNRGYVFSGIFGPPYRRCYSIKGDAVNLAARVMGKAEPGEILATTSVLDRARTLFQVRELEPFFVKGKKLPVQAFSVGPLGGAKAGPERAELPLVGREAEMRTLLGALAGARSGAGRLVEVVGEPGIGKSRLIEELRTRASDAVVVSAVCDPYESSTPYFPFRALLRTLLGVAEDDDETKGGKVLEARVREVAPDQLPWLPLLAVPTYLQVPSTSEVDDLDLRFKKAKLEEAVAKLLGTLLAGPTLLTFEDTHWMDEASAELLAHLVKGVSGRRWLVCVTRRDQASGFSAEPGPHLTTLQPAALSAEDATALAGAATEEAPLAPHTIAALAERSGGNPLFLQELVAASRGSAWMEGLPDTVEELLTAQIDRLAAPDRTLLRYVSVLGASFSSDLLYATLGGQSAALEDPDVWRRLGEFISKDSLGTFRYRHALIRDAAYEGLPYRRRRELHATVGETIERSSANPDEQAELLSLHFFHAQRLDKAWHYSYVAGERAQAKFANMEAAAFYRRALQAGRGQGDVAPESLARVSESLGDVLERAGVYGDAAESYHAARRGVAGDTVAVAGLLLKEGVIRERSGRYSQAMGWYRRGLRILEPVGSAEAAAVRAQLSVWYAAARRQQAQHEECVRWCLRAIEEAHASGEKAALAHAYRLLDWEYTLLGSPESAKYRGLALPIYEELGDLVGMSEVLNNLGIDAYFEGRWDEARSYYERSRESRAKTGDAVNAAHGTNNVAEILSDQGRLSEAETLFKEALRVWRAAGFRLGIAFATSNLGRVAARSGQHEKAHEVLVEAVTEFRAIGAEGQALETEARMAENFLFWGDGERAGNLAAATLDRVELVGQQVLRAMLYRIRGYAMMAIDPDSSAARASLEESLAIARSVNAPYEAALTLEALAREADRRGGPEPRGLASEAKEIFQALGVVSTPTAPLPLDLHSEPEPSPV